MVKILFVLVAVFVSMQPAQAASEDDCAIWLCLPAGFPSGCGGAYSAFRDRIRHFRPPLPPIMSCVVGADSSGMTSDYGPAAIIGASRRCVETGGYDSTVCIRYETVPETYVKGTGCRISDAGEEPRGCTRTGHYIDVFVEGRKAGDTYVW